MLLLSFQGAPHLRQPTTGDSRYATTYDDTYSQAQVSAGCGDVFAGVVVGRMPACMCEHERASIMYGPHSSPHALVAPCSSFRHHFHTHTHTHTHTHAPVHTATSHDTHIMCVPALTPHNPFAHAAKQDLPAAESSRADPHTVLRHAVVAVAAACTAACMLCLIDDGS